ncbi:MAG: sodium:solute symporter family transporter [Candidatus Hinthialibacter sp.]
MQVSALSGIDYGMMILYLIFTVGLGIYLGKNIKTGHDYFLAGRRLPWWAVGMSMVVSDIGAIDIVGIAGSAYIYGIVVGNYDWIGCIPVMVICGFVFIPYFWRSNVYTIPEFLGKRFNLGVRTIVALIWGVFLACNLGIMLYATAVMMNTMLDWPITSAIVISAVIIGLYTLIGGLTAVVYTDVIQCVVMMLGCAFVLVFGLFKVGGIGAFVDTVHGLGDQYKDHFNLILPVDTSTPHPWTGILLGLGMVLAPAYWFGNQSILQRCLGARSEFEAKASFMWGAILKTFIPFIMVVPGILVLAHNTTIPADQADYALPSLIRDILPTGFLGIFFAAFLAALMSSVDSCLNSAATLWTKDIYQRFFKPDADERHYLVVGRLLTVVFVVWGVFFAIWIQNKSASIYNIIQTLLSLFQGPSLMLVLLGVLWRRTTGIGALIGLICGLLCSTTLFLTNIYASEPLFQIEEPFLFIALWSFVVSMVIAIGISLVTPPEPEEKLIGLVYRYERRANHANAG